ncbi:CRISPR-associated helicase/endonuclease Cas3 [Nocardia sp. BMG51109]|uniref:CRISPR-associated helicase/endonuclease Cas3 n=1 Tax=Nocardia sp. BMG51109 TaxID=1056816 RepID=UPI000463CC7F|nr:CRISPR-associated helicase/endonuclease Cas3 [Nocardia sp. BMG51109]
MSFEDFVASATDGAVRPYEYQRQMAESGLPEILRAPTGSGKTLAAVLPWLYRRVAHPDSVVRTSTPRWLVVVLPQRTLVDQTVGKVRDWVQALGLPVGVHVLMGGADDDDREWKKYPDRERIFVGTQDMVLSRLLMRGFAESRSAWPMSFGLLHTGVQFVFDEVQLMGPAVPTSLQLQGLREAFGTAAPCRSMWMSATIDESELSTVDFHRPLTILDVTASDGELALRVGATRTIQQLEMDADAKTYAEVLAARAVTEHRTATRTLVVVNTVDRAVSVYEALTKLTPNARIVLLHSRFRPDDRARHTDAALAVPGTEGVIVISTQVLEAGVDVTSETLITETAPWSSIVQRAGRCNRDGRAAHARLLWVTPPGAKAHLPYEAADLAASAEALTRLEGRPMTGKALAEMDVVMERPLHPVLRRRDLLDLFDTTPDLAGNDIDVSPFVRDATDRTVSIAWRVFGPDMPAVQRIELCPAPLGEVQKMAAAGKAMVWDQADGCWRAARTRDVRPTAAIVVDAAKGGYLPDRGFAPASKRPVEPVMASGQKPEGFGHDPLSGGYGTWLPLADHLLATEQAATELLSKFDKALELTASQRHAITRAALLHDLGKASPSFATALVEANPESPPPDSETVWGKSPGHGRLVYDPPHFRHELLSALWLLDESTELLEGAEEPDLVVYLVVAHHGKVRVTVRGRPDESEGVILGVRDGTNTIGFDLDGQPVKSVAVSLRHTTHGNGALTSRALALRDRPDIGPFRLAFCEALVRAADWQASTDEDR